MRRDNGKAGHTIPVSERLHIILWRLGLTLADERREVDVLPEQLDLLIVALVRPRRMLTHGHVREVEPWHTS